MGCEVDDFRWLATSYDEETWLYPYKSEHEADGCYCTDEDQGPRINKRVFDQPDWLKPGQLWGRRENIINAIHETRYGEWHTWRGFWWRKVADHGQMDGAISLADGREIVIKGSAKKQ